LSRFKENVYAIDPPLSIKPKAPGGAEYGERR
jgi:hypothetical protein